MELMCDNCHKNLRTFLVTAKRGEPYLHGMMGSSGRAQVIRHFCEECAAPIPPNEKQPMSA